MYLLFYLLLWHGSNALIVFVLVWGQSTTPGHPGRLPETLPKSFLQLLLKSSVDTRAAAEHRANR